MKTLEHPPLQKISLARRVRGLISQVFPMPAPPNSPHKMQISAMSRPVIFYYVRVFLGMLIFCCISSVDAVPTSSNTGGSKRSSLENDLSQARGFDGKRNQERLRDNERAAKQQYPVNEDEVGIAGFTKWVKNLWKISLDGVRYGSWYWKILPLALIWMVYSMVKS